MQLKESLSAFHAPNSVENVCMEHPNVALTPELMAEIEPPLAAARRRLGHACPSEFSFANLYLFRAAHRYRYHPGHWPFISGVTYDGATHALPLFDPAEAPAAALAELLAGHDCIYPVAAADLARLDQCVFDARAARDDADYLYPARQFVDYRGARLRKKRQAVRSMLADREIASRALSSATLDDALAVLQVWMHDKGKARGEADEAACREALLNAAAFGLSGQVFYASGDPAGFILTQSFAAQTAVVRFAKGTAACVGIYPYMFQAHCSEAGDALEWLNFEQDLGNPNFRQTKLSFEPAALLDKFRVFLRPCGGSLARV